MLRPYNIDVRADASVPGPAPIPIPIPAGIIDDPQHRADVVGHHDHGVQLHPGEMSGEGAPAPQRHLAQRIELQQPTHHVAEKPGAPMGHDGDEIRAGRPVVVPLQADGTTVVAGGIVCRIRAQEWSARTIAGGSSAGTYRLPRTVTFLRP
jgi:hypothetical protein